ncbi:hypothetical protein [Bacillus stratosphericus]|uniref:hypothetical protein n=1 Tax=Bacillus stratosphericus TaxID=293386 RepID=UPI001CFAC041|nr:hypothetical protein [Bacillus stratosphericus]
MKKCMLYLNKLDLKNLHKALGSVNRIGRAVRTYIVREYELPSNENELVRMLTYRPGENGEITCLGLSESALAKLDETVKTLRELEKNYPVLFRKSSRSGRVDDFYSLIIRDIIKKMTERIESGDYSYEIVSKRFVIPEDIVMNYRQLYKPGINTKIELAEELENFILQNYAEEQIRSLIEIESNQKIKYKFTLDKSALDKVSLLKATSIKKITESKVMTDILIKFLEQMAPE